MFHIIIPARLSSVRLPNKILADIAGLPLLIRTAQQAKKTQAMSLTIAVDDTNVATMVQDYGFDCVITDIDHLNGTNRLAQAVKLLHLPSDAIVVNVQADEPMIDPELINQVANKLHQHPQCAIATAATPLNMDNAIDLFNPNTVKVVCNQAQEALYFSRAPIPFSRDTIAKTDSGLIQPMYHSTTTKHTLPLVFRHIGIYAYSVNFLHAYPNLAPSYLEEIEQLEQLRALWYGYKISVLTWNKPSIAGVDTLDDLERVRKLWK